ncbi:MAG: hypothetical protein HRU43_00465 [Simkaniaceae bacterium]|nr:hypothetical protein [Simkaniaceae bacterium]NRA89608.1 hypothetical protein [Simkaniaceae bacterium]
MAKTLKEFDQKIELLKQKKKQLEAKQASLLLKHIEKACGPSSSPQLGAVIIQDAWANASKDQKEKWRKAAEKFQFNKPRKASKTAGTN